MFLSSYTNSVDAKGRLSIPASFRSALSGQDRVVLWPSFDSQCLEGGGLEVLESYREDIRALPKHDPSRRAIMHAIFGRSKEYSLDSTGRIVLDREQATYAGLEGTALLVGLDDRFQVWNPEAYERVEAGHIQTAVECSSSLGAWTQSGSGG